MKKRYKVLSDNFRQYKALASNAFELDKKINVITKENIEELITSFKEKQNKNESVFFYSSHKKNNEEERKPIGKIIDVMKSGSDIGLDAVIEWNDEAEAILDSQGFYPSIEFLGNIDKEENEKVFWKKLQIKAVAAVEDPASKGVELLCASALTINNLQGDNSMIEKLKELLKKLQTSEKEEKQEAADELKDLLKKDPALIDSYFDMIVAYEKEEGGNKVDPADEPKVKPPAAKDDSAPKANEDSSGATDDEPKKEEDLSTKKCSAVKKLSAEEWAAAVDEHARKEGYSRASIRSVQDTYKRAKKLYEQADEPLLACLSACVGDIVLLDKRDIEKKTVSLSGATEDEQYIDIAKMLTEKE